MQKIRRVAAFFLVLLLLVGCSGESDSQADAQSSGGAAVAAEGFPFMGQAELEAFLEQNAGKPTMVMVWATWCPSCKQAIPELAKLYRSHGDKANIFTLAMDDKVEALEKYYSDKEPELPVYHGDQALAREFGVQAIPTLVIFNAAGERVFTQPGVFPHDMLKAMLEKSFEK